MLIAQITDSHVGRPDELALGRFDTRRDLLRAVATIGALDPRPDIILHTGDVTHHGDVAVYRDARAIMEASGLPHYAIPGNHDDIEAMRAAYADTAWMPKSSPFLHYVIDDYPVRLICLDSTIPNEVPGMLCEERLSWLAHQLAKDRRRSTLLALHQPPFRIGRPVSDNRPFGNADALTALIADHPNVVLLVAGHVHCTVQARIAQAMAVAAPSTSFQFAMDRRPDGVIAVSGEPPGYYMHAWQDGAGFSSHYAPIGDFGEPVPIG